MLLLSLSQPKVKLVFMNDPGSIRWNRFIPLLHTTPLLPRRREVRLLGLRLSTITHLSSQPRRKLQAGGLYMYVA